MLPRIFSLAGLICVFACASAQSPTTGPEWFAAAKSKAEAGNDSAAIKALESAAAAGFSGLIQLKNDPAFAKVQQLPQFAAVRKAIRKNLFPCEQSAKHREFDFWVGSWDVLLANQAQAGVNTISVVENGCMLEEVWRSATGGTGRSINYYDPASGKWVQQWIDATGTLINIAGGLQNGSMILSGSIYYTGTEVNAPFRGTWTPLEDGRVRQYFEQSSDDGETWAPWFEGFYQKQPE